MPHSVQAMVDREVRRWEAALKVRGARRAPCVAVSRLPWSGGSELARRLAEQLGYGLFDREIIDRIEQEHAIQRSLLEGLDERMRGVIDRYVIDVVRPSAFSERRYLKHLARTIGALGEHGAAVIVGRGAPFILPAERALRLLVVASDQARAERLAKERGLPPERARAALHDEDERRRKFLRREFGITQAEPGHYDLVLNLGTLSLAGATGLAIAALRDRFPGDVHAPAAPESPLP